MGSDKKHNMGRNPVSDGSKKHGKRQPRGFRSSSGVSRHTGSFSLMHPTNQNCLIKVIKQNVIGLKSRRQISKDESPEPKWCHECVKTERRKNQILG
jgi:hypothetical protein